MQACSRKGTRSNGHHQHLSAQPWFPDDAGDNCRFVRVSGELNAWPLYFIFIFIFYFYFETRRVLMHSRKQREQWIKTFDTNIHPFFFLSKYTLPHMKRGDTIITCASVNPYIGRADLLDYTSTKGAIVAFTRALSNQQVGNGIRVNAVCPGPSKSPWRFELLAFSFLFEVS
jgi:NAD(P)-dependent dehydrogenase (short-subunit alcohol dehydrogenase family)